MPVDNLPNRKMGASIQARHLSEQLSFDKKSWRKVMKGKLNSIRRPRRLLARKLWLPCYRFQIVHRDHHYYASLQLLRHLLKPKRNSQFLCRMPSKVTSYRSTRERVARDLSNETTSTDRLSRRVKM